MFWVCDSEDVRKAMQRWRHGKYADNGEGVISQKRDDMITLSNFAVLLFDVFGPKEEQKGDDHES